MDKGKIFIIVLIGIICVGLVSAAWFFVFSNSLSIQVNSLGTLKEVTLSIPSINLNTTNSSAKGGSSSQFMFNKAGSFKVDILETVGDLSGGQCLNGTGDCLISYNLYDGNSLRQVEDKQIVTIPANTEPKVIYANISCVAYSCPQTRDVQIKLTQTA
jgi:hypothetical protein